MRARKEVDPNGSRGRKKLGGTERRKTITVSSALNEKCLNIVLPCQRKSTIGPCRLAAVVWSFVIQGYVALAVLNSLCRQG